MSWESTITSAKNTSVVTEALYYLTRLLRHRSLLADRRHKLIVKGASSEPSAKAQRLAEIALSAIENETHTPIAELAPERVDRYVNRIEKLLIDLSSSDKSIEKDRIEKLLSEMRDG